MFIKRKVLYTLDYIGIIMIEFEAVLRKWGRSIGMVIPNKVVLKENLKEGSKVRIIIRGKANPLEETFGKFKFKKSTDQMMREIDRELWDE